MIDKGGGDKLTTKNNDDWLIDHKKTTIDQLILRNDDRSIDHTKMIINPKQCRGQQCYDQDERDHEWQRKWKLKWKWSSIEYYLTAMTKATHNSNDDKTKLTIINCTMASKAMKI